MAKRTKRPGQVAAGPGTRGRLLVVLLLAVIPYLNTWNHPFVYDDRALVIENDAVRTLNPGAALRPELGRYAVEWYRPLTLYSLALNYRVGAQSPVPYHVTNIALHTGNSALVYAIGVALLRSPWAAAVGAGLFAVHPIHVEAVTPISGRADLLSTLLLLLTWWLVVDPGRPLGSRGAVVGALTAFAAVFAKESAIVIWPIVAFNDVSRVSTVSNEPVRVWLRRRLPLYGALAIALSTAVVVRLAAIGGLAATSRATTRAIENPLATADLPVRLGTATWVLVKYCALLVWPVGLSADYSFGPPELAALHQDDAQSVVRLRIVRRDLEAPLEFALSLYVPVTLNECRRVIEVRLGALRRPFGRAGE